MARATFLHVTKADFFKQISALTIFALGFSLLGVITAPQASALNNYAAQSVVVDAVGRINDKVKIQVSARLADGVTTTSDKVGVEIVGIKNGPGIYEYSVDPSQTFATLETPTAIVGNDAQYKFSLSAPSIAGLYWINVCVAVANTSMSFQILYNAFSPYSYGGTKNSDMYCQPQLIEIGGAATKAVFSNKSLDVYPSNGTGTGRAKSQVNFYDSAGYTTRLTSSESFTIASTHASLSAQYGVSVANGTGNIPQSSKSLIFSGTAGDADGAYRFQIEDSLNQSSVIKGQFENSFGTGNFSAPASTFSFRTNQPQTTGFKSKLFVADEPFALASGTDGKLYFWGTLTTKYPGGSSYLPFWATQTTNKPKKIDFTPVTGQVNSLSVRKIISSDYVLSSDGVLYANYGADNLSGIAGKNLDLEPVTFPSMNGIVIVDATSDLNYILDDQGRVWKRNYKYNYYSPDYSLVDLSAFNSPFIKQMGYSSNPAAIFMLTDSGEVISQGDNTNGLLGQNTSSATSAFGKVTLPNGVIAKELYAGYGFAFIVTADGSVWSWGTNSNGQLGKDSTLIPFANSPILAILPVGAKGSVWNVQKSQITFLASDSKTVYQASRSGWYSDDYSRSGNLVEDIVIGNGSMSLHSNMQIYSATGDIGNCQSSEGYIRSVGQFGPVSTDDALTYSGIFLETDSGTSTVGTTLSMKVSETSTLQVVQPRTNCWNVSDLVYNWDLDGSENYATPAISSLSQTGYQAFKAVLNFTTSGRKNVKLRVSTPDGLDLVLRFIVGVEASVTPVIDFGDTSTAMVSGSQYSALGIGTDGKLYTWGYNNYGQLSAPMTTYAYRYLPMAVALPGNAKPRTVFSYYYNYSYQANFVVDTSGKVWGTGNSYAINGSYGSIDTFTVLSNLANYNIVDMQATSIRGFALTKSGQLLTWQLATTGPSFIPTQIVSLAGINIKNFTVQNDTNSGVRIDAVDTDGSLWTVPINSNGVVGDATKTTSFSSVRQLSFNGTQASIVATDGTVWYSVNGSSPFAQVSLPSGVTAVDAMANGPLYLLDSTKKIWTATPSQSGNTVTMSTWTAYAAQINGQASAGDQPIFQHKGSSFISFASGNLLYTGYYGDYQAGRCNVNGTSSNGNRVYSTGQFGAANVVDQISTSASVAVASQNATSFTNGQFFSANPGDAVVIRMVNPTSGCFNGSSQLTAVADTAGDGNFNTVVPLSNDGGGSYSFTLSGTAPTSGRKSISVRISTPLGTSSTISLGLGVFGTETITAIVPRTNPINTSDASAFAVASDGYAYGWSTPTDVAYDYNGSTMSFMNMITSTPPRNPGSPTKLQLPGNVRVRDAVPFTYCCSSPYYRNVFGVLAVDEFGRTWTWASESGIYMANTYAYGSVPTTATQIPGLVGENVVRIAVSPDGHRAMALTSKGIVYTWGDDLVRNMMNSRALTKIAGLAGLKILDIYTSNNMSYALTDSGDVYAFNGYVAYAGIGGSYQWEGVYSPTKVLLPETATAFMNLADSTITAIKSATGKVYIWGQYSNRANGLTIPLMTPVRIDLPNSRTPGVVGSINYDSYSNNVITATDGTWWNMAANAQNQIVLYQRANVSTDVNTTVTKFASGAGQALVTQNGSIYTTSSQIAGTCGPISTYTRVMSTGQFGPQYKADQVYIYVNGNEITRPNTPTSVSVTGWSACDGGAGITLTADYIGNNIFGDTKTATVSLDGSRATSTFTFTKTANGPVYMHFKATTAAGLSGTETFFTKVVPAPLPGRQIGISINAGDRYTNSSNVSLSLVWPDGTTKIYVSNDGGFAPGTVSDYDLQYTVPWVLPPQAVIPLPSIVYARFDNDPNTYYFDDIILDAIVPVLTYASAR